MIDHNWTHYGNIWDVPDHPVGLIQVDGKWPNLALMHIAGWLRDYGNRCDLITPLEAPAYGTIFAAKVFRDSYAIGIPERAIRGGTGWTDRALDERLIDEIEHAYPAYDLWGERRAMGHLTRGCVCHCPFCIVPQKEGTIRHHSHLSEWWHGQDHICLLDANIVAHPDAMGYLAELEDSGAAVDFSQGIDARLVTDEIATALARVRRYKRLHTAWDMMCDEEDCVRGIHRLVTALPVGQVMVYVLIGYNTTPEEDQYRCSKISEIGADPFVMPYRRHDAYQRRFARWVNHKAIYKTVAWAEYA